MIWKLVIKIKKEIKSKKKNESSTFQEIALRFDQFNVRVMNYEHETKIDLKVKNIQLGYLDFYENLKIQIL